MGLEELEQEILSQAQAEAQRMLDEARGQAGKAQEAQRAEAQAQRERFAQETEQLLAAMRQRADAALALESKKLLMAARKAVIDELFAKTQERLAGLGAAERRRILEALLKKARADIGVARVYCNAKDLGAFSGVQAAGAGIAGGLIAESEDATVRADYSFETLLAEAREKHVEEIASIVFK